MTLPAGCHHRHYVLGFPEKTPHGPLCWCRLGLLSPFANGAANYLGTGFGAPVPGVDLDCGLVANHFDQSSVDLGVPGCLGSGANHFAGWVDLGYDFDANHSEESFVDLAALGYVGLDFAANYSEGSFADWVAPGSG